MVRKMLGPKGQSATSLANEAGVSIPTLIRWRRKACTMGDMTSNNDSKRAQDWTALEKMQAILDTSKMSDAELGKYLRAKGLHSQTLEQWRETAEEELSTKTRAKKKRRTEEEREIRRLNHELRRKEKALAEAAALLVLKKKLSGILDKEDEETDSNRRKGK